MSELHSLPWAEESVCPGVRCSSERAQRVTQASPSSEPVLCSLLELWRAALAPANARSLQAACSTGRVPEVRSKPPPTHSLPHHCGILIPRTAAACTLCPGARSLSSLPVALETWLSEGLPSRTASVRSRGQAVSLQVHADAIGLLPQRQLLGVMHVCCIQGGGSPEALSGGYSEESAVSSGHLLWAPSQGLELTKERAVRSK